MLPFCRRPCFLQGAAASQKNHLHHHTCHPFGPFSDLRSDFINLHGNCLSTSNIHLLFTAAMLLWFILYAWKKTYQRYFFSAFRNTQLKTKTRIFVGSLASPGLGSTSRCSRTCLSHLGDTGDPSTPKGWVFCPVAFHG